MPREDLQWIIIDDFSPGIWSPRYGSAEPSPHLIYFGYGAHKAPLGAAQPTGTYRCVASPSGALIPAPAKDYTVTQAMLGSGSRPGGADGLQAALASHYVGPVRLDDTTTAPPARADIVFVTWGQNLNSKRRQDALLYKIFSAGAGQPTTFALNGAAGFVEGTTPITYNYHGFADYSDAIDTGTTNPQLNAVKRIMALQNHWVTSSFIDGVKSPQVLAYPKFATFTTDDVQPLLGVNQPILTVGHQGRTVLVDYSDASRVAFGAQIMDVVNDLLYYPNRNAAGQSPTLLPRPIEENQSGIRVICSVNANELFIVKATGGGAVIRGGLSNPTIVRLPGVHSVGDTYSKAIVTPLGVVFGGADGVYTWNGQDTSTRISQQIDGGLWLPTDGISRFGHKGQFSFLDPWVLCPNLWMFDVRHTSWWRLDDAASFIPAHFAYHVTAHGSFYGVRSYVDATHTSAIEHYSNATPATSFFWTSQAMTPLPAHDIRVRDVILLVEGNGTVQVLLTSSYGGAPIETLSPITINVTQPTVIRLDASTTTESLVVQIQSTAAASGPAPTIHGIRIGYQSEERHPANG